MKKSFWRKPSEYEEIDFIMLDGLMFFCFIIFLAVYIFNVTI